MESNEKYRVCCIVDNTQPEIKAIEAGSTTPGTEDNTGLHGSRADNAAGNKYGN